MIPDPTEVPIVDLFSRVRAPVVRQLLALAVEPWDDTVAEAVAALYQSRARTSRLLGWLENGRVLGLAGGHLVLPEVCEILHVAVDPVLRRRGVASVLVDAVAERLGAKAIRADTDGDAVRFWTGAGFRVRPIGVMPSGVTRYRAERRHPPEPLGFFTAPRVSWMDDREVHVTLPPAGNTLPLLPKVLRGRADVPAFVLAWVLEADEVGRMMQDLLPSAMPPVTPAVRPSHPRDAVGPVARAVGLTGGRPAEEDGLLPGLPAGVTVPMAMLRIVEMAARVGAWLDAGLRVRRWAEEQGIGDVGWIDPEVDADL